MSNIDVVVEKFKIITDMNIYRKFFNFEGEYNREEKELKDRLKLVKRLIKQQTVKEEQCQEQF